MDIMSAAITYFEHGISHDIFKEPVISYAKAAVTALRVQQAMETKYCQCENCDFWCENDPRCMCKKSQWAGCTVKKDNYCRHFLPNKEQEVPLTEEELRSRVGGWVWVVVSYERCKCDGWAFIPTPAFVAYLDQTIPIDSYGKRFVAYDHRPEQKRICAGQYMDTLDCVLGGRCIGPECPGFEAIGNEPLTPNTQAACRQWRDEHGKTDMAR